MNRKKIGLIFGIFCGLLATSIIVFAIFSLNKNVDSNELDRGLEITGPGYIMLSAEQQNVTIVAPGEYTLTGENKKNTSVIVDSENVTLILKDAKINTGKNAGIINLTDKDLKIIISDGTTNSIFGGNQTKYNAPIYSKGNVLIGGNNGLAIFGNRKEKSPIVLTEGDKKVSILGGTVVGLNAEKIAENFESPQNTLSINPNQKIERKNKVMIADEEGSVVSQFVTDLDFETLIINSGGLKKGKYTFSSEGKELTSGVID